MSGTGLTASAAKKAPHENLYVSDRPNGIAEPIKFSVSTSFNTSNARNWSG